MKRSTIEALVAPGRERQPPQWMAGAEEAALVAGLREGDDTAFLTLIGRHQASMLRVARAYVASHAAAEDVVQDTWLAVLRGVDRFDGRSSLKTWLYSILVNRAKTTGMRDPRCVSSSGFAPDEAEGRSPAPVTERPLGSAHVRRPQYWKQPPARS